MSDFRFANPDWSYVLWFVIAVIVLLAWLEWRRADALSRFLSAVMQSRLVHRVPRARRWLGLSCLGLAGISLVLALMRPQWGITYHQMPRVGAQIIVCLDVSKSMLAEDAVPNRLERSKAELTDLLSFLEGDQVGLIAFAGRAAVLCPLTPDFGFFKLILDGVGSHSVGRGGTRLEEPIRKALKGFGSELDVSRILVLITDGEDHGSHPLDAAKAAAERGVKILAIGFGDEAGSEVFVTDPRTGSKTQVRDGDGAPVISRLDGQTLRDMAMATGGAYIPAGTGALDLKSIYEAHIAPMVHGRLDDRGHIVRREMFQWAVLTGFVFLIASVVLRSGSVKSEMRSRQIRPVGAQHETGNTRKSSTIRPPTPALQASLLCLAAILITAQSVNGQDPQPGVDAIQKITADGVAESSSAESKEIIAPPEPQPADPRDVYNEAVAILETDLNRADQLLVQARRGAGTDGDVRFRATYNLGWVEVKHADKTLDEDPEKALTHLRRAADWFRDAVRLRPKNTQARHNLEVVLRRVLELGDSLAKPEERSLAEWLDELIETQRGLVGTARQVVDRVSGQSSPNTVEQHRVDFRQLALQQRKIISEGVALLNTAREELDALEGKSDEQKTSQDKVRAAQLTGLLHYLNAANQRLGKARGQMRRRQAERSFRRAASGLAELKRARDQLRGPVEVLDQILAEADSLVRLTSLKAADESGHLAAAGKDLRHDTPMPGNADTSHGWRDLQWLTRQYLGESQQSLTERTSELTGRLRTALEHQPESEAEPADAGQPSAAADDDFLEMVSLALPFLEKGQSQFESAGLSLTAEDFSETASHQMEAIAALRDGRERFLDMRGLIDLAYLRQAELRRLLSPQKQAEEDGTTQESQASQLSDITGDEDWLGQQRVQIQFAKKLQAVNLDRGSRIANLVEDELVALLKASDGQEHSGAATQPSSMEQQQAVAKREQLELAKSLIGMARDQMDNASGTFAAEALILDPDQAQREASLNELGRLRQEALAHVDQSLEHLQALRRLFFSLVEHLRETAQRQADLNDQTERVAALMQDEDIEKKVGPLSLRQRELQAITQEIAEALHEQSQQQPGTGLGQGPSNDQAQQIQQITEQYAQAAKLVAQGGGVMQQAAEGMTVDVLLQPQPNSGEDLQGLSSDQQEVRLGEVREYQDVALQKLVEALAMLEPQQPQQQQNEANKELGQDSQQGEQNDDQDQQTAGSDPSRLLQSVRDREAQRRRQQEHRQKYEQVPVEKDW